jgi:hypothetical protein
MTTLSDNLDIDPGTEKANRYFERVFSVLPYDDDRKVIRSFHGITSGITENQIGFSNLAEAEALATREYSIRANAPVHTLLLNQKIAFDEKTRLNLAAKLEKDGFTLLTRDFSAPIREGLSALLLDKTVWIGPKGVLGLVAVSGKKDLAESAVFASTDTEMLKSYAAWWSAQTYDNLKGRISTAKISGIFQGKNGPQIRSFREPIGWPVELDNYDPAIHTFYEKVREDISSRTPPGRLVLLDGPPGTGKTFILRGLVHDLAKKAEFIYLPASLAGTLDGPSMISLLDRDEPITDDDVVVPKIFIIEDADECLISRGSDNMSSIRNLLNYCDGFLGALLDVRIIATTNSGHIGRTDKIDKALMRPGRLLAHATVGSLSPEQAEKRLQQLCPGKSFHIPGPMSLAELYALARERGWKPTE